MTLTKNRMVREIGRRTRLKNHDVETMLEALMEVWIESLAAGERIELENLFVLETQQIDRGETGGVLGDKAAPRYIRQVTLRASKYLKRVLNKT